MSFDMTMGDRTQSIWADDPEVAVELSNVSKCFRLYARPIDRLRQFLAPSGTPLYREYRALDDLSLTLRRSDTLGIVGVNGAGKSTLLQLMAGTLQPTTGTVKTRGRVAALLELGSGFNPDFTGLENIYLNAATLGLSKAEIDARLQSIIDFSGIGRYIDQPVRTYSSGMYVRLAFSIATSIDPDILIVDEALSVGDGAFARKSFDRIMHIRDRGACVLFCSHTLFHVEVLCKKVLWLDGGRVREYGGDVPGILYRYQEHLDSLTAGAAADGPSVLAASSPAGEGATESHDNAHVSPETQQSPAASGTASIRAVRVIVDGVQGQELLGRAGSSCLRMEIDFASDPALPTPTAALVISSDTGRILATHLSAEAGIGLRRMADGTGCASVTVDSLPFNKGRYRVGAYLMCERGIHVYQWIDPVAHVELSADTRNQGYFLLDACWAPRADANDAS